MPYFAHNDVQKQLPLTQDIREVNSENGILLMDYFFSRKTKTGCNIINTSHRSNIWFLVSMKIGSTGASQYPKAAEITSYHSLQGFGCSQLRQHCLTHLRL